MNEEEEDFDNGMEYPSDAIYLILKPSSEDASQLLIKVFDNLTDNTRFIDNVPHCSLFLIWGIMMMLDKNPEELLELGEQYSNQIREEEFKKQGDNIIMFKRKMDKS
tara:strand:+ start:1712 stop:2032 length:321 start_codon:yes stop_codon:yes gene_type:complete